MIRISKQKSPCLGPDFIVDNSASDAWIEFLPMPGDHSDVVHPNKKTLPTIRYASKEGVHTSKSYLIGVALSHQFLRYFGSPIKRISLIDDNTALTLYNNMQEFYQEFIEEYRNAYTYLVGSPSYGTTYDRTVLTAYEDAQATVPQVDDVKTAYSPYMIQGFINVHHWILAVDSGKPNPNLDFGYLSASQDRIDKWKSLLG